LKESPKKAPLFIDFDLEGFDNISDNTFEENVLSSQKKLAEKKEESLKKEADLLL